MLDVPLLPYRAVPPDLLPEPILHKRQQHITRLAQVNAALEQGRTLPTAHTRKALLTLQAMLREEIRRLETAWRQLGPSEN